MLGRDGRPLGAALIDAKTRAAARLVGRMERVDMDLGPSRLAVVFDGAHVPFNLAAVLSDLARFPDLAGPCVAVVALASDKDAAGFLTELRGPRDGDRLHRAARPQAAAGLPPGLPRSRPRLGSRAEAEPEPERAFRRGVALAAEAKAWSSWSPARSIWSGRSAAQPAGNDNYGRGLVLRRNRLRRG